MDLIGVGFTRRNDRECSVEKIDALIDAIPDEKLRDEEFLNVIDPSGYLGDEGPLDILEPSGLIDEIDTTAIRDSLKEGAREFDGAASGHRMTTYYEIGGTPLSFIWTGGGSWGDDPFDGFTPLCYFISLADLDPAVAEAAGFVCGGLPDAATVAGYAEGG